MLSESLAGLEPAASVLATTVITSTIFTFPLPGTGEGNEQDPSREPRPSLAGAFLLLRACRLPCANTILMSNQEFIHRARFASDVSLTAARTQHKGKPMQNDELAEQYRKLETMVEKRFPGRISKIVAGGRFVVVHKDSLAPDVDPEEKRMIEAILQVALHYGNTVLIGDYVEVFTLKMVSNNLVEP
jgi:hypothetical protein